MPRRITFLENESASPNGAGKLLFHDYLMHYESEEESVARVRDAIGAQWVKKVALVKERVVEEAGTERRLIKNVTKA